jgi:hypothetical protein
MTKAKVKSVRLEVLVRRALKARLQALARRNERSATREAMLAIRRHLEAEEATTKRGE